MPAMVIIVNGIDMPIANNEYPIKGLDLAAFVAIADMLVDELFGEVVHENAAIVVLKYEVHVFDAEAEAAHALHGKEREIFEHAMVVKKLQQDLEREYDAIASVVDEIADRREPAHVDALLSAHGLEVGALVDLSGIEAMASVEV